jgi:hypothetical protein
MKDLTKQWINDWLEGLGRLTFFFQEIVRSIFHHKIEWCDLVYQLHFIGVKSQSVVLITGAFTGMVLTAQTYFQFHKVKMDTATLAVVSGANPGHTSLVLSNKLQPKTIDQLGVKAFDNWYAMFGDARVNTEQRPDGSYHEVDSSEMAFKVAGSIAFQDAAKKAQPVLLEPMMKVEVVTPDDYTGAVTGDLSSRRGHVEGQISRGGTQIITAMVPLSTMFGYSTDLRSRTQGRATYTMHFEKYMEAPRNVSEEVVARVMGKVGKE